MTLGLDYAGGRPGGAAIVANGYQFVVRYLSSGGPGLPGKLLTADEYADLQRAGVAVACNWETSETRMLGGRAAGHSDALAAAAVCLALGHPTDRPIYFSADWDASPAQQTAIDDYLAGAADAIGLARVGVYGGYWVVKRCLDNGTARWAWQASAWSPTNPDGSRKVDPRAHLFQRLTGAIVNGVPCDINEARQLDFGQHPGGKLSKIKEAIDVIRLPATSMPSDLASAPKNWTERNFDVVWNVAGGWEGGAAFSFGVQDWPGRTVDTARGYLLLASWIMQNGKLVPVNAGLVAGGGGLVLPAHMPSPEYAAPAGCVGVTLNYAAPGEAYVAIGRSG